MAIPPSKLREFIDGGSPEGILEKLRNSGIISEDAQDAEVRRLIQEAFTEEADEIQKFGFTWASAASRIPGKLSAYLTERGREWAVPYGFEDTSLSEEELARRLFEYIENDGWTCTHCLIHGGAHKDFRLSLGPAPCVICRKCGWVQEDSQEDHLDSLRLWFLPDEQLSKVDLEARYEQRANRQLDLCKTELRAALPGESVEFPKKWLQARLEEAEALAEIRDLYEGYLRGELSQLNQNLAHLSAPKQTRYRNIIRELVKEQMEWLMDIVKSGGEFWHYRSPNESWEQLMGRAGFAVVKDGRVIWSWITMMN